VIKIEIKPNELDCPLRLSYECGMRERECKDCIPGVYELVPVDTMRTLRAEIIPQALKNAAGLAKFEGQEMEARAREWAAMYVKEAMDVAHLRDWAKCPIKAPADDCADQGR